MKQGNKVRYMEGRERRDEEVYKVRYTRQGVMKEG